MAVIGLLGIEVYLFQDSVREYLMSEENKNR